MLRKQQDSWLWQRRLSEGGVILYLKELTELDGVSGNEQQVREFISDKIKDKVDELRWMCLDNFDSIQKRYKRWKENRFGSTHG